jgi:EmrB/QacA subfamily drug resistance transporter
MAQQDTRQQEARDPRVVPQARQDKQDKNIGRQDRQQDAEGEHASKWAVFSIVAIGVFMATLDSSIVNISLPKISSDFGVALSGAVEWVIIAYLVMTAAILLSAGRLADMIGRKVIWATGLFVFTLGSALCGAAPALWFLIAARAFQGLGGALLFAASPVMLTTAFPASERGRALGLNAVIVALGVSVGPTLGGFITAYFTWRWIFYINVPLGIIGIILTWRVLTEKIHRNPGKFDPLGAVLLAIGLALVSACLSFGQELGWTSPLIIGGLVIGVAALIALPFVERRVQAPILDLSLFKNRVFVSANLSLVLSFLALFAVSFIMPFYLEQLRAFPVEIVGLLLTPLPIMIAIVAPISGRLADRFGSTRWLASGGLTIACVGLVLVSFLNAHSSIFDIIWRLLVTGFGQALFQSPNNSALLGSAPPQQRGVASGFLATGRVMGQSLSVALAGAIFTGLGGSAAGLALTQHKGNVTQLQQTFQSGFHVALITCAVIAAIGVFASLVRGKGEQQKKK